MKTTHIVTHKSGIIQKYFAEPGEMWKLHCDDGPAVINANFTEEYWLNGKKVSEVEFNETRKQWLNAAK